VVAERTEYLSLLCHRAGLLGALGPDILCICSHVQRGQAHILAA
jgi:hypothetical protein